MAFTRATIEIRPASVGTGIKVGLRRTKKAAAAMTVYLSGAGLKAIDFAEGDKCEVLIGDGEHHGLIRIRKNNSGAGQAAVVKKDTGKGIFYAIKLGHQPAFVDRTESALWCQWETVEEGWVEIALPKWADETSPNKPKMAPPTAPVQQRAVAPMPVRPADPIRRGPGRPPKSVTANVMGDPPPGRREMLAKMGEMKV